MNFSYKISSHTILRYFLLIAAIVFLFQETVLSISEAATPSSSSPRLVGTVEGGPFSGAVLDDGTGVQAFYRLHEKLPDGSTFVKVRSDSIVIKKDDGALYELFTTGTANSTAAALPAAPGLAIGTPDSGERSPAPPRRATGVRHPSRSEQPD